MLNKMDTRSIAELHEEPVLHEVLGSRQVSPVIITTEKDKGKKIRLKKN